MRKTLSALAGLMVLVAGLAGAQTWDRTKPATGSPLVSAEVRGNFQALDNSTGQVNLIEDPTFQLWPSGTSSAPYGWTLAGTGAAVAQETGGPNLNGLGPYAAKVTYGSAAATLSRDVLSTSTMLTYFRGKTISVGIGVKTSTASQTRVEIADGVGSSYSSYHTGGGAYEWLTATRTLDATATKMTVSWRVETSGSAYAQGVTVILGPIPPQIFAAKRNVFGEREILALPMGLTSDRLTAYALAGPLYRNATTYTVTGTTKSDSGWSWTIPANTLATGRALRITILGDFSGTQSTTSATFDFVFGGTTLAIVGWNNEWANASSAFVAQLWLYTTGTTAHQLFGILGGRTTGVTFAAYGAGSIGAPTDSVLSGILCKTRMNASGASQSIRQQHISIEVLPEPLS